MQALELGEVGAAAAELRRNLAAALAGQRAQPALLDAAQGLLQLGGDTNQVLLQLMEADFDFEQQDERRLELLVRTGRPEALDWLLQGELGNLEACTFL